MPEYQELRSWGCGGRRPDNAEMIAAVLPLDDLNDGATKEPFPGEVAGALVPVFFFETGGLDEGQLSQRIQHLRKSLAEEGEEFFGKRVLSGHEWEMVTTSKEGGNAPARSGRPGRPMKINFAGRQDCL